MFLGLYSGFFLSIIVPPQKMCYLIGYEPAGLTVHRPPPKIIEGGFIFFVWVSSVTKIFS